MMVQLWCGGHVSDDVLYWCDVSVGVVGVVSVMVQL